MHGNTNQRESHKPPDNEKDGAGDSIAANEENACLRHQADSYHSNRAYPNEGCEGQRKQHIGKRGDNGELSKRRYDKRQGYQLRHQRRRQRRAELFMKTHDMPWQTHPSCHAAMVGKKHLQHI